MKKVSFASFSSILLLSLASCIGKNNNNAGEKETIYIATQSTPEVADVDQNEISNNNTKEEGHLNIKVPSDKDRTSTHDLNTSPYPMAPGRHKLYGKAEGKYPIVVVIEVSRYGDVTGRMAYKSTLDKYGDDPSHYMYFKSGYFDGNRLYLSVEDDKGNLQDWDLRVTDNGSEYKLNGSAYSYTRDKTFSISINGK